MKKRNPFGSLLRKKTEGTEVVVAIAWYTPENWERVKAAATDPGLFEATFAEWEAMAIDGLATIRKAYPNARKFHVESSDLLAWCLAHGRANDSEARTEFVSEKAHRGPSGEA